MALTVCCPCGNPLDCDHLELVVAVTCPNCSRELTLEVESGAGQRAMAVLTIMEGPSSVGEQFIMPVGHDLIIGKAAGNWLSLESDAMAGVHCRLRLSEKGRVLLEDLESQTGTWIGHQRIARGRLASMQSFSVGGFRFRLDLQSADGTTMFAAPPPPAVAAKREAPALPTLAKVSGGDAFLDRLITNRFLLSRWAVLIFAWLTGIHHAFAFISRKDKPWPWLAAILMGLVIGAAITAGGRRVTLARQHSKFAASALLVVLGVADLVWALFMSAIASAALACAVAILIALTPSRVRTAIAITLGAASMLLGTIAAVRSLIILLSSLS